jgi:hypothetical protein
MTKFLLAGASAFALMTGAAFAQGMSTDTSTSTQSTTSTTAPVMGTYNATKSQKAIDSDGTESQKSQTYSAGMGGTKATSNSSTTSADGSQQNSSQQERTSSPMGGTTSSSHTSTTTTGP